MRAARCFAAAAILAASPAAVTASSIRERFDGNVGEMVRGGCAGSGSDWERLREIADPGNGSLRSRGVENESCALLPGVRLRDGTVSVRFRLASGKAGLALRHRDPDHYVGVYLDAELGLVSAVEWDGTASKALGSGLVGAPPADRHVTLTAALRGRALSVFLDGQRILTGTGLSPAEGEAGVLAGPLAAAEFDEAEASAWGEEDALVITPAFVPDLRVGREAGIQLACRGVDASLPDAPECRFSIDRAKLPPGLRLGGSGTISGSPREPGDVTVEVVARAAKGGFEGRRALRLSVDAVSWPRFPLDPETGEEPSLAVLYTSDDIGQSIVLSTLGEPDDALFRMHADHPRLRMMLMACPANRYISDKSVLEFPRGVETWRALALDPRYDWVDLGGHGYTHSPPDDSNVDHHEFDPAQSGCSVDHAVTADRAYCERQMSSARAVFRKLGIPDAGVFVFRFPGAVDNPEALRALRAAGFLAVLGRSHPGERGREWWRPAAGGGEILEIEDSMLVSAFARDEELERELSGGMLAPSAVVSSPRFQEAVDRGLAYAGRIEKGGGILNLADHFWETFERIGGAEPRYLVLDAVLDRIESTRAGRLWQPGAGELAQWLEARRSAEVSWKAASSGVEVALEPPAAWSELGLPGLERASLRVALPAGAAAPASVRIREGDAPERELAASSYRRDGGDLLVSFPFRGPVRLRIALGEARK